MTSTLIEHRIELLLTAAMSDRPLDEPDRYVRLVAGALALVQQHAIDDKGRCQFCTSRRRWHRVRARPCTVYTAFSTYLMPPDNLVQQQIADLLHQRHTGKASARTTPMLRLSDW
jgi:hypothetical protein